MSVTAVSVKDFVIDISEVREKTKQKKIQQKQKAKTTYNVILQNNIDFVIHKKTTTTDKNLVFLISQNQFYIQDNKTKDIDTLSKEKLRGFFQSIYWDKFEKLDKVVWWQGSPEKMIEKMIEIVSNTDMQKMYQHGICVDKYKIDSWKEAFKNNVKLFKYCYDKCQESRTNRSYFDHILKLATTIEKEINFNNAKIFIDRFCKSSVKMFLEEGYKYNAVIKPNHEMFLNLINTYSLDFNRFIDYISIDLYSQGISQFDKNTLIEYNDYLQMQVKLYDRVKEKHPKYLRTEHDIIALKVTLYEKHKQELMLLDIVDNFKHLEYKDREFCIVLPESSMNIVDEGVNLSHCVADYIDKVANNEKLIVFLRTVDESDKSLVTVEIKDNSIVQAKGYANRLINKEEEKFLMKWAKAKELHYSI